MNKETVLYLGDTQREVRFDGQKLTVDGQELSFDQFGQSESFSFRGSFIKNNGLEESITVPYKAELADNGINIRPALRGIPLHDRIAIEDNNSVFPDYKIFTNDNVKEVPVGDRTITYDPEDKQHRVYCDGKDLDIKSGKAFVVIDGRGHDVELERNGELSFSWHPLSWDEARMAKTDPSTMPPEYPNIPLKFEDMPDREQERDMVI